jgi:hypothetical protein
MSSLSRLPPGTPGVSTPKQLAQLHEQIVRFLRDGWGAGHDAYAALSARGRNQLVPDSTHGIPNEKPDVVIFAVIEVLDEIKNGSKTANAQRRDDFSVYGSAD